jgi:hypothetical protein
MTAKATNKITVPNILLIFNAGDTPFAIKSPKPEDVSINDNPLAIETTIATPKKSLAPIKHSL